MKLTLYEKKDYIETAKGNRIARSCILKLPRNVRISGKTVLRDQVSIRGDRGAKIELGRYVYLSEKSELDPTDDATAMKIGSSVFVGRNTKICGAKYVGTNVYIGEDVKIGKDCVIKDNVIIEDGSVLAPGTLIPPFSMYGGKPARLVAELPLSVAQLFAEQSRERYRKFKIREV